MGAARKRSLKERAWMLALDGAIVAVVRTIDAYRFVRKITNRRKARR